VAKKTVFAPHLVPGCGIGTILRQVIEQFTKLGWRNDEVVFVTGIGCTGRASGYVNAQTLHTIHGRALPTATGIKMARPDMHVVAMLGDGDGVGIGGNHFIHAAKRNIGITAIVVNNRIYGMTGGQVSPTTPSGAKSSTTPYGNVEPAMDVSKLALGAGATFVARAHTANPVYLGQLIRRALEHDGFSVLEVLSQCPTYLGVLMVCQMLCRCWNGSSPTHSWQRAPTKKRKGKYPSVYSEMIKRRRS